MAAMISSKEMEDDMDVDMDVGDDDMDDHVMPNFPAISAVDAMVSLNI